MTYAKTQDGVNIFYKDWGSHDAQPIVFHHGWPLSADDWDNQMMFFLAQGYRVVAIDRRGHGRSDQVSDGHDMDHYAADVDAVVKSLDLQNAIHIGHSTGGGQVARYVAKYGQPQGRVAKAVLISSVPPLMVKTENNPEGTPVSVFDEFRKSLAANRSQFYFDVASGPFYGFNRSGADVSQGTITNWWRQGMMGSAKAHYEGIKAFSETDQTEDLNALTVPVLVMQGDDDQVVPYKNAALLQNKLIKNNELKIYEGFPHGMHTSHADVINKDILAFIKNKSVKVNDIPITGFLGFKEKVCNACLSCLSSILTKASPESRVYCRLPLIHLPAVRLLFASGYSASTLKEHPTTLEQMIMLQLNVRQSDPVPTDPTPMPDPIPRPQPMPDPRQTKSRLKCRIVSGDLRGYAPSVCDNDHERLL